MINQLFVANWKMNMPFFKALQFYINNQKKLQQISKEPQTEIVLCPSFPALYSLADLTKSSDVKIGAQNCSEYKNGAYTGEVDALSLKDVGCTYCIIGHSERRAYFGESNEVIAQKALRLVEQRIQPIICIGETKKEYEQKQTTITLERQLNPIIMALSKFNQKLEFTIAYEPIWSIGTGIIADESYLAEIFNWLNNTLKKISFEVRVRLLYGGSIDENNALNIKKISFIDGFLIGGASLDFQKFQKIVLLK